MNVTMLTEFTQKALAQAMGSEYASQEKVISALKTGALVDVGNDVDEANAIESYARAMVDVIGKYDVDVRDYQPEIIQLYIDRFDWGGFIERVKFDFNTIIDDPMYNLVNNTDYSSIEHKFYKPTVLAKIFKEGKAIALPISIQTESVKTAFLGMTEMSRFISGIREQILTQKKIILDTYSHLLVSSGIAVSEKVTNTSVHLITEAIAKGILNSGATVNDAMNSDEFRAFALERIANLRKYLKRPSKAFNNKNINTWSNKVNLCLLAEFDNACKFRTYANTYNEDKLDIGEYDVVTGWQGVCSTTEETTDEYFTFDELSKVMIDDTDNKLGIGESVTISNCIGLLYDYKALGITNEREKTTSSYTAVTDHWNEFYHMYINMALDSDYSMVALMLD